jgi:hypothetical protein
VLVASARLDCFRDALAARRILDRLEFYYTPIIADGEPQLSLSTAATQHVRTF